MNLKRNGIDVDERQYINTSHSMVKMQSIVERLLGQTPELQKAIPFESNLYPPQMLSKNRTSQFEDQQIELKTKKKIETLGEYTAKQCQEKAAELDNMLQEQHKKNLSLNEDLETKKEMFVKRELEYRRIIEDLQEEIKQKTLFNINDSKHLEIAAQHHKEILDSIGSIQQKTALVLENQEKDIIKFFNNMINDIKKQFQEERLKKGEKDKDYLEKETQLISELEWIKNIAQKIDNENHNLLKKYMDLKAQYQTQENDREMLLKELIMKKKQNALLKNQIDQYEQLLNEVSKDDIGGAPMQHQQQQPSGEQGHSENQILEQQQQQLEARPEDDEEGSQQQIMQNYEENYSVNSAENKEHLKADDQQKISPSKSALNKSGKNFRSTGKQSKVGASINQRVPTPFVKYDQEIKGVQGQLRKEQIRVRELKQMYVNEISAKTELERIMRKCVDDIKEQIIQLKGENRVSMKERAEDDEETQHRDKIIERLLNNERILTLIYDKTFYPDLKNIEQNARLDISKQLSDNNKIMEVNEDQL